METPFEYYAFISYKREDEKKAKWLQKRLETYKIPIALAQEAGKELPKKFHPCFRDITGTDKTGRIENILYDKLQASKYLIVVCSPRSAKSPWVNREVEIFQEMGRDEYIIPYIIEGKPDSSNPDINCYPTALDENIFGVSEQELKKEDKAVVKTVAIMSGLSYDKLWDRERERIWEKRKNISLLIAVILIAFIAFFIYKNNQVKKQRDKVLISQSLFLSDLSRQQLEQGNGAVAIMLALEALPKKIDRPNRPYVSEAEFALRNACYYISNTKNFATFKQESGVRSAVFSPDGEKILIVAEDIKILDSQTGEVLFSIDNSSNAVINAVFNFDGTKILLASMNNTAIIYDIPKNKEIISFEGHKSIVRYATFSPDGKKVLTSSNDSTARIWDASTGKELMSFIHRGVVTSAIFSKDEKRILTASFDNTAKLWDTQTKKLLLQLKGHKDYVWTAVFNPDETKIVTASEDSTAKVWNAQTGQLLFTLIGHKDRVWSAVFNSDGTKIVTASGDNTVKVWDAITGKLLFSLIGHKDDVESAIFNSDGTRILTASLDRTVKIWTTELDKMIVTLTGHTGEIWTAAFSPNGEKIVSASADSTVKLWDVPTGKMITTLSKYKDYFIDARFSPDGKKILTASNDTIKIWDVQNRNNLFSISNSYFADALFSADGTKILTTSSFDSIQLFNAINGERINSFSSKGSMMSCPTIFSADGTKIIRGLYGKVEIIDIKTGKVLISMNDGNNINSVALSPDETKIVTASNDSTAKVWDTKTGKLLLTLIGFNSRVGNAVFSPDGMKILTTSIYDEPVAKVWDSETGKNIFTLKDNRGWVTSAIFSFDGKRILTTSTDFSSLNNRFKSFGKVWDALSGNEIASLDEHNDYIKTTAFSPDDKIILTASYDKTIKLWKFYSLQELINESEIFLNGRQFTKEEKKNFFIE